MNTPTVVVGIDGGPASRNALRFALDEARMRKGHVVAVMCWPTTAYRDTWGDEEVPCLTHECAGILLDRVIADVTAGTTDHPMIVRDVSLGSAGPILVHVSRHADLLVVGSATRGPLPRHLGHHVLEHCLRYATAPVTMVPDVPSAFRDESDAAPHRDPRLASTIEG